MKICTMVWGDDCTGLYGHDRPHAHLCIQRDGHNDMSHRCQCAATLPIAPATPAVDPLHSVEVLNAFINGAMWEAFNFPDQVGRNSAERTMARRAAAEAKYPKHHANWEASIVDD